MTTPLFDDESRQQFNCLMEAMEDIDFNSYSYDALNDRIHQAVTEKPNLARIVNESNQSLLSHACHYLNLGHSRDLIKCLIRACPFGLLLLTQQDEDDIVPIESKRIIYMIARHPLHCEIMPWIAINYSRVLGHERCPPVVFDLLAMYAQRGQTNCTASMIKQFLVAYPRAFEQVYSYNGNVFHVILRQTICYQEEECEVDFFIWMAERCPHSLLGNADSTGCNPLHLACYLLFETHSKGWNTGEICKYLIQKCPDSARVTTHGRLPIHILQSRCKYTYVREVVVCLLREYPQSIDIPEPNDHTPPSSFLFIRSVKLLLDEEKDLRETAVSLTYTTSSLTEALTRNKDKLTRSALTVFGSWTTSFINTTEDKLKLISNRLKDMCNEGLEHDE